VGEERSLRVFENIGLKRMLRFKKERKKGG
jgi:hypothetical protein